MAPKTADKRTLTAERGQEQQACYLDNKKSVREALEAFYHQ